MVFLLKEKATNLTITSIKATGTLAFVGMVQFNARSSIHARLTQALLCFNLAQRAFKSRIAQALEAIH